MPNWTTQFDEFWLNTVLRLTNTLTDTKDGFLPTFEVDAENHERLVVAAREVCIIEACFQVNEIADSYDTKEKHVHLANLEQILHFFQATRRAGYIHDNSFSRLIENMGYPTDVQRSGLTHYLSIAWSALIQMLCTDPHRIATWPLELLCTSENSPGLPLITVSDIRTWANFMGEMRKENPEDVLLALNPLSRWRKFKDFILYGGDMKRTQTSWMLETHISICNRLAQTGSQLFITEAVQEDLEKVIWDEHMKSLVGICRRGVKVGHKIVLIEGVSLPLVVRSKGALVALRSPALVGPLIKREKLKEI